MSAISTSEHQAVAHAAAAVTGAPREVLSFRLGPEEYGIDILRVQEIRGFEPPTRIAHAPPYMLGVVNLRGTIVPIVDMRVRFGLEQAGYDGFTVVIVLNVASRTIGIVVDSVSDVLELKPEQVRAAPEFDSSIDASYITGLGSVKSGDDERLLILMDIERMMRSPEMGLMPESLH